MRKPVMITMAIVVMALVGMMFAANMALKPYTQYARIGQDLTNILEMRKEIEEGTTVFTLARAAKKDDEKRLGQEGWGLLIELTPSDRVRKKKGSLEKLALRAAREAGDLYGQGGKPLEWFEVKLALSEEHAERTLIKIRDDGRLTRPDPRLPATAP